MEISYLPGKSPYEYAYLLKLSAGKVNSVFYDRMTSPMNFIIFSAVPNIYRHSLILPWGPVLYACFLLIHAIVRLGFFLLQSFSTIFPLTVAILFNDSPFNNPSAHRGGWDLWKIMEDVGIKIFLWRWGGGYSPYKVVFYRMWTNPSFHCKSLLSWYMNFVAVMLFTQQVIHLVCLFSFWLTFDA